MACLIVRHLRKNDNNLSLVQHAEAWRILLLQERLRGRETKGFPHWIFWGAILFFFFISLLNKYNTLNQVNSSSHFIEVIYCSRRLYYIDCVTIIVNNTKQWRQYIATTMSWWEIGHRFLNIFCTTIAKVMRSLGLCGGQCLPCHLQCPADQG